MDEHVVGHTADDDGASEPHGDAAPERKGAHRRRGHSRQPRIYTPWTNTWTPVASMHYSRTQATATRLLNGKVLVVGDRLGGPGAETPEIYTPWTNTWTLASAMPAGQGRCGGDTADLLGTGRVLITGGCATFGGTTDAIARVLTVVQRVDRARDGPHPAGPHDDGTPRRILSSQREASSLTEEDAFSEAEIYDPSTSTWTAVSSMNVNRSGHVAASLLDGRVLVAGGLNNAGTAGTSAELYDPASDTWTIVGSMASSRVAGASATRLSSGRVLVVGGVAGVFGPTLDSTEVFGSGAP